MASLNQARNRFLAAIIVLLIVDAAALGFLFTPWGRPPEQREAEYNRLRAEWQQKRRESQPLVGMPEKLRRASKDADAVLKGRVADQSSGVSDELGKLAAADHVKLEHATYETKDAELPGIQRIVIKASLSADYLQLMKFINGLERSKLLIVLDSVKLNEQQGGAVGVDMVMESYAKAGS
jgi:Tfp pilus assembly protein PilO